MTYIDDLTIQVAEVFHQARTREQLQEKVLELIQAKAKESFKNGLEAAQKRQSYTKGQKTSKA